MKKTFQSIIYLAICLISISSAAFYFPIEDQGNEQQAIHNEQNVSYVNLNKANEQQLTSLKGVGSKKAMAIISYRNTHGEFKSIKEILKIQGIGKQILLANKNRLII